MRKKEKRSSICRILCYVMGLLCLAMGIILNTKAGLGVSPIISVAYSISTILGINLGDMTFVLYATYVLIELVIHAVRRSGTVAMVKDLLQLPMSLIFTRFINLFFDLIPAPTGNFALQFVVLLAGILFTGVGAAMSLDMRIIPNPGDGIVQVIADAIDRPVGFTKNCFDVVNISITICVSLIFAHRLIGIGVGTVVAVAGVGRVIALFNHLFLKKLTVLAGMEPSAQDLVDRGDGAECAFVGGDNGLDAL